MQIYAKNIKEEFENLHVKGVEEVRNPFDGPRDQLNIFPVKVRFSDFWIKGAIKYNLISLPTFRALSWQSSCVIFNRKFVHLKSPCHLPPQTANNFF